MSLDYWSMKLSGAFVSINNKYHMIAALRCDDPTERPKFPEDMLPDIDFELENGKRVKFEDFTIKFPDDQAILKANGRLSFVKRSMSRQYKIAPTREMFRLDREDMNKFLLFNDSPEYSNPEEVFLWDRKDKVFSKNIGVTTRTSHRNRFDVLYCGLRTLSLRKREDYLTLEKISKKLPLEVESMFGQWIGEKIPYHNKDNEEEHHEEIQFRIVGNAHNIPNHLYGYYASKHRNLIDGPPSYRFFFNREGGQPLQVVVNMRSDLSLLYIDGHINSYEYDGAINMFNRWNRPTARNLGDILRA